MNLKLKEIIWEITTKCDKGCKYCGSKDIINSKDEDYANTIKIAKEIAKYPPEQINISGGEPGCMDQGVLCECVQILKDAGCVVKIITNGEAIKTNAKDGGMWLDLFKNIDAIGLSVNSPEDIKQFKDRKWGKSTLRKRITIITNFGTHNIWDFEKIEEIVSKHNLTWQVQLTEGEFLLPPIGITHLLDKLNNSTTKYVIADNLQLTHQCQAGLNGCGITYDGGLLPCLSMRSWADVDQYIVGNVLQFSLQELWENEFKDRRFGDCEKCKCCRSDVEYPKAKPQKTPVTITWPDGSEAPDDIILPNPQPHVTLYGVWPADQQPMCPQIGEEQVFVYGVVTPFPEKITPDMVQVYGVTVPHGTNGDPIENQPYTTCDNLTDGLDILEKVLNSKGKKKDE